MKPVNILLFILITGCLYSCHKKSIPGKHGDNSQVATASAKKLAAKSPAIRQLKTPVPKVITVNDNAAKKTFDGRLYYDLEGHRYWRNYRDGKYYLYHVSMNTNPDFKKP